MKFCLLYNTFWRFDDYAFFPKPIQQPHPPIYAAGARTPATYIWAGRNGFHLCTAFFAPNQDGIRKGIALYHQALQGHGHNPAEKEVAGVFQFSCGESNEEAHRNGGSHVFKYFRFFDALRRRSPHTSQAFQQHQGQGVDATGVLQRLMSAPGLTALEQGHTIPTFRGTRR
jgi:alkanesulfonate monooxygenase SsuD/methylene tetrahydromethanopterin reductase-like flavin-dependent oxidoreductase (luciferase family)